MNVLGERLPSFRCLWRVWCAGDEPAEERVLNGGDYRGELLRRIAFLSGGTHETQDKRLFVHLQISLPADNENRKDILKKMTHTQKMKRERNHSTFFDNYSNEGSAHFATYFAG